jgi:hypothetical protein
MAEQMLSNQESKKLDTNIQPEKKYSLKDPESVISNVGMNFTDAGLSAANAALWYRFMEPQIGMRIPYINFDAPGWAVYGLACGGTSLLTGLITRSIVPSVVDKFSNPKLYNLLQVGPLVNIGVGMVVSYGFLWSRSPNQQLSSVITGELVKKKDWMPLLKDGVIFGASALAAQWETDKLFGILEVMKQK